MTQKKPVFLMIDGSSLLFRAFYAIRHLTTRDGVFTNGVYGFLNMFWAAREQVHPDYILVAFDRAEKTVRAEEYAAYKGTREETPSELSAQFGMTRDVLEAMGIFSVDMAGYEADDIIGTASRRAAAEGMTSVLLTGDRDYFQLVDDQTTVLYTKRGISSLEVVDLDYIDVHYGVTPAGLIEVKGLMGDASDNIPGISGVGEKTALKLIREFGTIEGIYENLDAVSGKKLKERLEEGRDVALMSRRLGTILRDLDLPFALEDCRPQKPDADRLRTLFDRLEFDSLAARFGLNQSEARTVEANEALTVAPADYANWVERLQDEETLVVALLADDEAYLLHEPVACILRGPSQETALIDLREDPEAFCAAFGSLFADPDRLLVGYDIKATLVLMNALGLDVKARYEDVMLMEYLLDPNRSSYDAAHLTERIFGHAGVALDDVLGKGKKRVAFSAADEVERRRYAASWAETVQEARPLLRDELERKGMRLLFDCIENPLVRVLADMEIVGVAVDEAVLDALDQEYAQQLEAVEREVYEDAGETFNIQSPKQLGDILFEKLGLPHGKKTKTGYSTNAEVLEKLKGAHPIVQHVLEYRKLSKLKSTYIEGLRAHIASDGRIHSTFRQNVAATGRLSSTDPNLQNIPVRTEEGRKLRAVFVAEEGQVLVDSDYSQIELRILASLSGDATMQKAFEEGLDIHRKTAAEVNHIAPEDVTPLQRAYAKAVNFGIIYGISDYGLSQDLGISRQEAREYIETYKDTYPAIRTYMDNIVEEAKRDGVVTTFYGRKRPIPELQSKNFNLRSFGERIALNTPIQGTAADVMKIAMIRVAEGLKDAGLHAHIVLQIHDELIVEAPESEREEAARILNERMESIDDFDVKLVADQSAGKSWLDAKS